MAKATFHQSYYLMAEIGNLTNDEAENIALEKFAIVREAKDTLGPTLASNRWTVTFLQLTPRWIGQPIFATTETERRYLSAYQRKGASDGYQSVGFAEDMPATKGGFTMVVFKGDDVPKGAEIFIRKPKVRPDFKRIAPGLSQWNSDKGKYIMSFDESLLSSPVNVYAVQLNGSMLALELQTTRDVATQAALDDYLERNKE